MPTKTLQNPNSFTKVKSRVKVWHTLNTTRSLISKGTNVTNHTREVNHTKTQCDELDWEGVDNNKIRS